MRYCAYQFASNKLEPLKGFGRFTFNLKRFQKIRRVSILIFHKELGKVRGFYWANHQYLYAKNKLLQEIVLNSMKICLLFYVSGQFSLLN
ncbi:hypothetical protein DD746_07580 [Helicobacter pylori]|nr:hypothetical protein [Helicobacter pylori]RKV28626.1 hypothetical protein DD746_07580 [Helicobacter pylori]RKV48388.1 hypothetical protein DD769_06955 [Helicobacter pylori]